MTGGLGLREPNVRSTRTRLKPEPKLKRQRHRDPRRFVAHSICVDAMLPRTRPVEQEMVLATSKQNAKEGEEKSKHGSKLILPSAGSEVVRE